MFENKIFIDMSITNREEANEYFGKVNKLIDGMVSRNIRPSMINKYVKNGSFKDTLEANGIDNVNGIDRVLSDVLTDWVGMEEDGILTFENFKTNESEKGKLSSLKQCLYDAMEGAGTDDKMALADCYNTDMSAIMLINQDSHPTKFKVFKIDGWEGEKRAMVFTVNELNEFYKNVCDLLFEKLCAQKIELISGIEISLDGIIEKSAFERFIDKEIGGLVMGVFAKGGNDISKRVIGMVEELTGTKMKSINSGRYIFEDSGSI